MKIILYVTRVGCMVCSQASPNGFIREQGFYGWSELVAKLKDTPCTVEVHAAGPQG